MTRQPVIAAGTIAALVLAAWNVVLKQGLLEAMRPEAQVALDAFINLLVPIVAAIIAARFVTPVASPNLRIGTVVNEHSDSPTGIVVRDG